MPVGAGWHLVEFWVDGNPSIARLWMLRSWRAPLPAWPVFRFAWVLERYYDAMAN